MLLLIPSLLLLIAFVSTSLIMPLLIRVAKEQGWVDQPDGDRKVHTRAIPRVGGIAIIFGFTVSLCFLLAFRDEIAPAFRLPPLTALAGALLMVAVGFYDDTRVLNFKAKFGFQIVAAYLLLHAGYRVDISAFVGPDVFNQALYSIPLTILWVVGIINAVNLIDGLDGLAAGICSIALVSLAAIFGIGGDATVVMLAVITIGALLGFLVFNFNPASIFMGDSGSLFLGYMLAALSLSGKAHVDPIMALLIPVVMLGVPVIDTGMSIVRRVAERRNICAPDRDHIHHRLIARFSTRVSVMILYAAAIWFAVSALIMSLIPAAAAYMMLLVTVTSACAGLSLLGYVRIPSKSRNYTGERVAGMSAMFRRNVLSAGIPSGDGTTVEQAPGIHSYPMDITYSGERNVRSKSRSKEFVHNDATDKLEGSLAGEPPLLFAD